MAKIGMPSVYGEFLASFSTFLEVPTDARAFLAPYRNVLLTDSFADWAAELAHSVISEQGLAGYRDHYALLLEELGVTFLGCPGEDVAWARPAVAALQAAGALNPDMPRVVLYQALWLALITRSYAAQQDLFDRYQGVLEEEGYADWLLSRIDISKKMAPFDDFGIGALHDLAGHVRHLAQTNPRLRPAAVVADRIVEVNSPLTVSHVFNLLSALWLAPAEQQSQRIQDHYRTLTDPAFEKLLAKYVEGGAAASDPEMAGGVGHICLVIAGQLALAAADDDNLKRAADALLKWADQLLAEDTPLRRYLAFLKAIPTFKGERRYLAFIQLFLACDDATQCAQIIYNARGFVCGPDFLGWLRGLVAKMSARPDERTRTAWLAVFTAFPRPSSPRSAWIRGWCQPYASV